MKIRFLPSALCGIFLFCTFNTVSGQEMKKKDSSVQMTKDQQDEYFRIKNDWANLERYREENALVGALLAGEKRVVFMGNSITQGWKETCPEFFTGRPYFDRGISGQTTPQMLLRFRQDVINLKPMVVVILAGTNDIAGNTGPSSLEMIEDNIVSMVEIAQANNISIVLSSVLPASDFWWNPGTKPAGKIAALNAWIREYAYKNKLIFLDYYTPMVDEHLGLKSIYSEDGVHPNKAGYQLMAPLAEEAIKKAMGKK